MKHRIAVVFDEEFGDKACSLAEDMHVWLVSSSSNNKAVSEYLAKCNPEKGDPLGSGITTFHGKKLTGYLLESIWDHHGDYAHEPPLSEMVVIGIELSNEMLESLHEYGFILTKKEIDRFVVIQES